MKHQDLSSTRSSGRDFIGLGHPGDAWKTETERIDRSSNECVVGISVTTGPNDGGKKDDWHYRKISHCYNGKSKREIRLPIHDFVTK